MINCISSTSVPYFRSGKKLKYCFDVDGTICSQDKDHQYHLAEPYEDVVKKINELYDAGHKIIFFSARGSTSGKDWTSLTGDQLNKWGVKFHQLIMNQKPDFDVLIDDKVINAREWRENYCLKKKIGFVASCFDLLHAGHCMMLQDAKTKCDHLIAALQTDPTIDRPSKKNSPIQGLDERFLVLESNKYVDEVVIYETEKDLVNLLKKIEPDIRILGDEYEGKDYTGKGTEKKAYFHKRSAHGWSTTNLRQRIFDAELEK